MSAKDDLQYSIRNLFTHREKSYGTHANYRNILKLFAKDLISLGYSLRNIDGLKQKHIIAVVEYWKEKKLDAGTIKNRMSVLRRLCCDKLKKPTLIPSNKQLNINNRSYVPKFNRAILNPDFSKIKNPYVRISLELQRTFGMRREESIKIKPHFADKGEYLVLYPTWCKGGRGRIIPIKTEEQRYWLEQAKIKCPKFTNSLIPKYKNYVQQLYAYEQQLKQAKLKNMHGLRHAYAQRRYKELTGWDAPINGGPKSRELTKQQKKIDYQARMILSEELGHSREQITVNYVSR